jgi:glycosyltransferase involved in cell wall biosynthesis
MDPVSTPPTSPVRFKAFGGRSALSQIARIEAGLEACGAVAALDGEPCTLIYANDAGSHAAALAYRDQSAAQAKVILNVLDIPEQLFPPAGDYTSDKLAALQQTLRRADAITAISPFTRSQIQRYLGLAVYVIYNPVKDVAPDKRLAGERPYPYRVLLSGRCNDRNKRIRELAIPALITAGFNESEVAVVGGEWPGWGTDLGIVSDEVLNDLLNSVDITVSTTALTGLELGPIESMICGAVPVLTYDVSTFHDLGCYPQHWGCYPSPTALAYRMRTLMDHPQVLEGERSHCLALSEGLREQLSGAAVARRILDVYQRITLSS